MTRACGASKKKATKLARAPCNLMQWSFESMSGQRLHSPLSAHSSETAPWNLLSSHQNSISTKDARSLWDFHSIPLNGPCERRGLYEHQRSSAKSAASKSTNVGAGSSAGLELKVPIRKLSTGANHARVSAVNISEFVTQHYQDQPSVPRFP